MTKTEIMKFGKLENSSCNALLSSFGWLDLTRLRSASFQLEAKHKRTSTARLNGMEFSNCIKNYRTKN